MAFILPDVSPNKSADTAMYAAKQQGRNKYRSDAAQQEEVVVRK